MRKIILMKGLPASGKTTWALNHIKDNPNYKRINKDSLRDMFDGGKWSRDNEKFVLMMRNEMIELSILEGFDVIVDDTNLAPKHIDNIKGLIDEMKTSYKGGDGEPIKIKIEIEDLTDVPLEDCIKHDLKRERSVGKDVIMGMYNRYLKPIPPVVELIEDVPSCLIVDLDGTLAHMINRGAYEWDKVGTDSKDETIAEMITRYDEAHIILLSGRDGSCKEQTEKWLEENGIKYNALHMRKAGDMRKDTIIKEEIYKEHIEGKFNVLFVLDDRDQVVEKWRSLGLKCLQCASGNF